MIANVLVIATLVCAFIPACLFCLNLWFFREPAGVNPNAFPRVDVLIPARNEAANIEDAVRGVLASRGADIEVWVYDDNSSDATASIVQSIAAGDTRVHLVRGAALPEGWNGKQHACWQLAQASSAPLLLFLDADVRLEPEAIACCIAEQQRSGVSLLSGFPRIVMVTWMEWLVLPLIHFVLLGLLPIPRMRRTTKPAYAAGCGQFMLAERKAYFLCGGHAEIPGTRHDGLKLPHMFREHGLRTDICDLTNLAHVRMYCSAAGVWNGLAKNATEGLGAPGRIVPITMLLLCGQVLPLVLGCVWLLLYQIAATGAAFDGAYVWTLRFTSITWMLIVYNTAVFLPRILASVRFRQPLKSVLFHPIGVALLLALQWYALVRQVIGKPVGWRARRYSSATGGQIR